MAERKTSRVAAVENHPAYPMDDPQAGLTDWIALWVGRLLLGGVQERIEARGEHVPKFIQQILAPTQPAGDSNRGYEAPSGNRLKTRTQQRVALCLERLNQRPAQPQVIANTKAVAAHFGLTAAEQWILAFLAVRAVSDTLEAITDVAATTFRGNNTRVFGLSLSIPEQEIEQALAPKAPLIRSGLVRPGRGVSPLTELDYLLSPEIVRGLFEPLPTPEALFQDEFHRPQTPEAASRATGVPDSELHSAAALISGAVSHQLHGVNVLLYGPSGCGKSTAARRVADTSRAGLYAVNQMDRYGHLLDPNDRLQSYRLLQALLPRTEIGTVVFDDADEVLRGVSGPRPIEHLMPGQGLGQCRTLLEDNRLPSVWVVRSIDGIDPGLLNRFTEIAEVPAATPEGRHALLENRLGDLPVSEAWVSRISQAHDLRPADISKAAQMGEAAGHQGDADANEALLEGQLQRRLRLRGEDLPLPRRGGEVLPYDLLFLNGTPDPEKVAQLLADEGSGTVLIHGPPGTGKSAFAEHLSSELSRPLLSRTVSELLSCWLGETEQRLAKLFADATHRNAVLQLDEAESFLTPRAEAHRSWEVTQTNELLMQLERFPGLLICTTNFLEGLDTAALRRFDLKVRLDPLRLDQAQALLTRLLDRLEIADTPNEASYRRLQKLDNLTPGDFATVGRRALRMQKQGYPLQATELIDELEEESRLKPDGRRRQVGFL